MKQTSELKLNYYPGVLWNTPVFGKNRSVVASNIYEKDAELEYVGNSVTNLKTDLLSSEVYKANIFEIILLKYLPIAFVIFIGFNVNLFYPSMVGMTIACLVYLAFYQIKRRISTFFGYVFLASLFLTYIFMFVDNFNLFLQFNINNIGNYVIQYFLFLWLFEKLFIDIYSLNFMDVYKIKKLTLGYFQINDEVVRSLKQKKEAVAKKLFTFSLLVVAACTFILGGVDLINKVAASGEAQKQILLQEKNERKIIQTRNASALKELLNQQSKEIGINKHNTKEQIALLEDDFETYVRTQPIAYERLRINLSTQLLNIKTGETISPARAGVVRSWVQNYKGVYRWHYEPTKGQVFVIMNTKAR